MKKILALLLTIAIIISALSANLVINTSAVEVGNLIANGSFDETPTGRCPSPYYANPAWTTAQDYHKWFRPTGGNDINNSSIIVDPNNPGNQIARAMQTIVQGVTVTAGKTYRLTFSVKADYNFQKFNISFADVTDSRTDSVYPVLNNISKVIGTKTYTSGGQTVTEECSPLYMVSYPNSTRLQMALTNQWVTYELYVTITEPYLSTKRNSNRFCALKFQADDWSGTAGNPANAPFYLDNVSLYEVVTITAKAEDVSAGQTRGYIETADTIYAAAGESVTIKAVPFSGNTFTGWYLNGVLVSTNPQYTFTAGNDAEYIAKFSGSTLGYVPKSTTTADDIIAPSSSLMINYPHYGTPAFVEPGQTFTAEVRAPSSYGTSGWSAWVENEYRRWVCSVGTVTYGNNNVYLGMKAGYAIPVTMPSDVSPELLTLVVRHSSGLVLRSPMSVSVVPNLNANYYIMAVTDTHMGWNFEDTQTGNQSPTAWGLMCQALKVTGIRFLSLTGDTSLFPLNSKGDNLRKMIIEKQLQYSGTAIPFIMTAGNHEYDPYVYPQASLTTHTVYDPDGDGIPEFDGLGNYNGDDFSRYFGMQSALMPMGSMLIAKHDFYAYWGDRPLISAMATKWNAYTGANYRLLFEHTHNDLNRSLFNSPAVSPTPTPYPNLELKGHDHQWTVNQTSPYRVLSLGGGSWEGGSGAIINFNYSNGNWNSPADSGSWTKSQHQYKLINDARYNSPSVKVRDVYANPNDGTATSNTCTIVNEVNFNFFDGRVRFVMKKGSYTVTNGNILSQYDSGDGTKTIVLVKVNIPANGSITVSINPQNPPPVGDVLLSDGFNTYQTGVAPAGWTVTTSGGPVTVEEVPSSTEKSLKLYKSTANSGYSAAEKKFTAQTSGVVRFDAWVMSPETSSIKFLMMRNDATSKIPFKVSFDNGYIKINDSITIQPFTAGQWYHIVADLDIDTQTLVLYVDDQNKGTYNFYAAATDLATVMFSIAPNFMGNLYVNNITVTKVPQWQIIASDSFNTYTTGQPPQGGWILTTSGGPATVEEVPSATEKSLKLYKSGTSGYSAAEKKFTAQTSGVVRFDAWVMTPESSSIKFLMMRNDAQSKIPFKVSFDNGNIKINDSITVQPFTAGQWYHIVADLNIDTQTLVLYVNDQNKGTYNFYQTSSDIATLMFSIAPNFTGTLYVNYTAAKKPV